jgi:hypothetical protein
MSYDYYVFFLALLSLCKSIPFLAYASTRLQYVAVLPWLDVADSLCHNHGLVVCVIRG